MSIPLCRTGSRDPDGIITGSFRGHNGSRSEFKAHYLDLEDHIKYFQMLIDAAKGAELKKYRNSQGVVA